MDFVLTEEQQMFQKLFRDFATKEVAKVAEQTDKKEEFPTRLIKRAAGQGFLGVFAPEEPYGGAGLDFFTYTLLVEAVASECASTALTLHVHNVLALRTLVKQRPMYGLKLNGRRCDIGNKDGFVRTNVEFALKREDMADDLRRYLKELAQGL